MLLSTEEIYELYKSFNDISLEGIYGVTMISSSLVLFVLVLILIFSFLALSSFIKICLLVIFFSFLIEGW